MVTLCPHRAKKLHPSSASHLALQQLQRRLSGTSSCVFITTAGSSLYANTTINRAASQQRLFAFCILFKQPNRKHFAIRVLSRIVVECSLARRGFRPRFYPVVSGHTMLACAGLNCLKFAYDMTAMYTHLNVPVVPVIAF